MSRHALLSSRPGAGDAAGSLPGFRYEQNFWNAALATVRTVKHHCHSQLADGEMAQIRWQTSARDRTRASGGEEYPEICLCPYPRMSGGRILRSAPGLSGLGICGW